MNRFSRCVNDAFCCRISRFTRAVGFDRGPMPFPARPLRDRFEFDFAPVSWRKSVATNSSQGGRIGDDLGPGPGPHRTPLAPAASSVLAFARSPLMVATRSRFWLALCRAAACYVHLQLGGRFFWRPIKTCQFRRSQAACHRTQSMTRSRYVASIGHAGLVFKGTCRKCRGTHVCSCGLACVWWKGSGQGRFRGSSG